MAAPIQHCKAAGFDASEENRDFADPNSAKPILLEIRRGEHGNEVSDLVLLISWTAVSVPVAKYRLVRLSFKKQDNLLVAGNPV